MGNPPFKYVFNKLTKKYVKMLFRRRETESEGKYKLLYEECIEEHGGVFHDDCMKPYLDYLKEYEEMKIEEKEASHRSKQIAGEIINSIGPTRPKAVYKGRHSRSKKLDGYSGIPDY